MQYLKRRDTNKFIYKTETDAQMELMAAGE